MDTNVDRRRTKNRRYTLNIDNDPRKVLQPVWGYANEPLVTLAEACKPLYGIVSRLEPHVWVAMENSKNPADNLTQNESAAIYLYTMEWKPAANEPEGSLYKHLNHTLREVNRAQLQPWFRYLKLFLTALAKLPISHRQIIWRGIRKDQTKEYLPGTKLTWWAFTSCTESLNVLESDLYLGKQGARTLFSIEALNGRTIQKHSHFTAEDEILLLPGTYLEVASQLNPAPGLYIIHLRQIQPPHEMLEPPYAGARLLAPPVPTSTTVKNDEIKNHSTGHWYKKKKIWIIAGLAIVLIVLAAVLGGVLGSGKSNKQTPTIVNTTIMTSTIMTPTDLTPPFKFNESANNTVAWSSGYWYTRNDQNSRPGNYNWTSNNVVLDPLQGLYMRLTRDTSGNWWCSQVKSADLYTFGSFTFEINATIDKLDPNVEFRMFTMGADNQTNQISIDIGRRGRIPPGSNDLWYTISPNTKNGSIIRVSSRLPPLSGTYTTHRINWMTSAVTIQAEYDHNDVPDVFRQFNSYSTNTSWAKFVPQTPAYVFISLCTYNGSTPTNNQPVEINARRFIWIDSNK